MHHLWQNNTQNFDLPLLVYNDWFCCHIPSSTNVTFSPKSYLANMIYTISIFSPYIYLVIAGIQNQFQHWTHHDFFVAKTTTVTMYYWKWLQHPLNKHLSWFFMFCHPKVTAKSWKKDEEKSWGWPLGINDRIKPKQQP